MKMKSSGMLRNRRVRSSCRWSAEEKAWVKSRYASNMSFIVRVGILDAETRVGDGSGAVTLWAKALLFRADDFVGLYVFYCKDG